MDPTRYQNVKRSLARRSRDKDVAAFQWTFGTGLGPVVNLTWTVENCYQASPNGTNAIQLIYMHPIMKRLMWVFLYFQSVSSLQNNLAFYLPTKKKKLPQSSARCQLILALIYNNGNKIKTPCDQTNTSQYRVRTLFFPLNLNKWKTK